MCSRRGSRATQGRRILDVVLFLAFVLPVVLSYTGVAKAQIAPEPGLVVPDSGEIVAVKFVGNNALTNGELQSVITTRACSFLDRAEYTISFGALGFTTQYADEVTQSADTLTLVRYYRSRGFLNAHVRAEVRTDLETLREVEKITKQNRLLPRNQRADVPATYDTVYFFIQEGSPAIITGITYEGLEDLPNDLQPELAERSLMKRNVQYASSDVAQERDRLTQVLGENGYPLFQADSVIVDPQNDSGTAVHVLFYFEHGHRYKTGHVRIEYDTSSREKSRVSESTIRSQIDIDSGNWYRGSDFARSASNLSKLGNFEYVRITLDTNVIAALPDSGRDGSIIPVIVDLKMLNAQELVPGLFAGFGSAGGITNTVFFGLTLGYHNRNVFGGAQFFDFESLYQMFPGPSVQIHRSASVDLTFPFRRLPFLSYIFPVITNSPLTIGLAASQAEQQDRADEKIFSAHTALNVTIGDPMNRTSLVPDLAAEYVFRQYGDSLLKAQLGETKQVNTIASISGQWDRTNDQFNPTRGFYTGGTIELGTPILKALLPLAPDFGSASYFKWLVHLKNFVSLNANRTVVLGARVRFGEELLFHNSIPIPQQTDIPIERRFFAGGVSSVRGWPSQALLVAPRGDSLRSTVDGGYKLFEFNLEMRWTPFQRAGTATGSTFLAPLQIAYFFDAGQTWDYGLTNPFSPSQLALAVGAGVRYLTLLGPLRIDIGFKLYDPNPIWGTQATSETPPTLKDAFNKVKSPAYPDTKGQWLFGSNGRKISWDVVNIQFNIGQAF